MDDLELRNQLQAAKNIYISHLPDKAAAIQKLWDGLVRNWQAEPLKELHRLVHTMSGSAGTFGFKELSSVARTAESILKNYSNSEMPSEDSKNNELVLALKKISNLCNDISISSDEQTSLVESPETSTAKDSISISDNRIFLVDDDEHAARELSLQIGQFGYDVIVFRKIDDFRDAIIKMPPAAVIMDIVFPEGQEAGIDAIKEVQRQQTVHLPVIFISSSGDLNTRLNAVRSGGDAYLTKPVDINLVVETLDVLTSCNDQEQYRILIVDDDEDLSQYCAAILRASKMEVMVVNKPFETMQALIDFDPELILMDIYMPECTGLELAKVIRQNISHINIPIVFMSNQSDQAQQDAALRTGGDDFLTKPIEDNLLISSVIYRVQRSRKLASAITRDSLTGLLNHAKICEQLELEVIRAKRQKSTVAFAMVDLDYFKQVNDKYGHVTGDYVIREISRVLTQQLRRTDIIGRYGGEEFAVIFPDTTEEAAASVLEKIREKFAQIKHKSGVEEFSVTFSCGVSGSTLYDQPEDIISSADEFLYMAKSRGRNCVVFSKSKS